MIRKTDARGVGVLLLLLGIGGASAILAQTRSEDERGRPKPPPEAFAACRAKVEGASCAVKAPDGAGIAGQCHAPPGLQLACVPPGGRPGGPGGNGPPGGAPPQSQQGAAIPSRAADTRSILCSISRSGMNASAALPFDVRWACDDGKRSLVANGVPDHAIGAFPNAGNPNRIASQTVRFSTTLDPVEHQGAGAFVKVAGFALNGVKFDPGTAQSCDTACADHGEGHGNPWRIEALGQTFFAFGVDANNAHVQPGGVYHYHGVPSGMLSAPARAGRAMALVGWAVDGYPIYARLGHADPTSSDSPLRAMRPSYRLKARPDAGRPPIDFAPMGTFTQDYEYVAGLGDLDECNGRHDVTPEFPRGIYHYYATDAFPFVQRCVKGTPARVADDGPPPFGRFMGPPR